MKKRILTVFLIAIAAVAAAFAFVGCKQSVPQTTGEYVVFDDGCGKSYTLRGGEHITVFYAYDEEKELNFTQTYYDQATGKITRADDEPDAHSCGKPEIFTRNAHPLTDGKTGKYEYCYLTVIVSARSVSGMLSEHDRPVFGWLTEGVGADYSFTPEMTGNYTVDCTLKNDYDEVAFAVTDIQGNVVGKDEFLHKGWKYYVHVRVKSGDNGTSVGVTTSLAFTPREVKLGDNEVTLGDGIDSCPAIFAFTPEEGGVYSFTNDSGHDSFYEILDGETYERITRTQWESEAALEAGKKYFVRGQVGFSTPIEATLTVKRADRQFAEGVENQLKWNEMYVFTAQKKCNYKFTVEKEAKYSVAATLTVYSEDGWTEYSEPFKDSGEFDLLLSEGKHIINVDKNCTATCVAAPQKLKIGNYLTVSSGERASFTAPFDCKYAFSSLSDCDIGVLDADGNDVKDEELTAGEEYFVYTDLESDSYSRSLKVDPIAAGEFTHNVPVENVVGNAPYLFTPAYDGTYRFIGASELAAYYYTSIDFRPAKTDGDKVILQSGQTYYVVVKAETLTYGKTVTARYYPTEIPADGITKVECMDFTRFDLLSGEEVTINLEHRGTLSYKIYDADFNEIKTGEFVNEERSVSQVTVSLQAGGYYLYCGNYAKIWFDEPPLGGGGIYTVEKGEKYIASSEAKYRYALGLGQSEFSVTVTGDELLRLSLKEAVDVYYMDGDFKKPLGIKSVSYSDYRTVITFYAKPEVGQYFIEFPLERYNFTFAVDYEPLV